nr:hypothetical protein [Tanacetum cinerariifolium]
MSSLFADTHNVVAILEKSDAAEGFEQIINFLSGSYIHYALTVNPHIYISCIKQFWNTAFVKRSADVTRLQALVDKKKIVIFEAIIHEILQLDDAEGVVCLSNEEIFAGLAQMEYEKLSTKLTFYKAFFSSQWKFLIHTLLQSLSAKRTSWNEFSTAMASAVICLSKGQKFNFSKYIFDSLVRNVDSSSKFYMYPRFIQLIIQNQVGDLSTHTTRYISPALTQKVFANMRRVGKGFSGVETPLFAGMLVAREVSKEGLAEEQVQADGVVAAAVQENVVEDVANEGEDIPSHFQQVLDTCSSVTRRVEHLEHDNVAQKLEIVKLKARVKRLEKANKGRMIADLDIDEGIELVKDADIAETDGRHAAAEQAEKQAEIYHLDLDHPSKVMNVFTAATSQVSAASATISAAKPNIIAAAPTLNKGKGILVESPKPMKKKDQIKLDAEARKLHEEINKDHEEINKDIDWDAAMDHVNQKSSKNPQYIKRYQGMKKRPQTESEARKNMMIYLKNTVGYKMDFFKGMSYKAAKRRKLNEEAQEDEELKKQLEIVNDEDDDVFTEATPLGRKVLVVDYEIVMINNKPRYKIIKADVTHQLYISFITLLKNFDREDLEDLWRIVKEIFSTSKPRNYSDDYLLATLKTMFEKPDGQDAILELMLSRRSKKNTKCVNAVNEELTVAKHKLMILKLKLFKDIAAAADMK